MSLLFHGENIRYPTPVWKDPEPVTRHAPDTGTLRLMAVHAHPDDESSKGAASMAKYVREGVEVLVVTCTGGERGDILNPQLKEDPHARANLTAVRRMEMERARDILGVEQVWLGFIDSGLPEGEPRPALPADSFAVMDPHEAARPLVKLVRERQPHVMLTYDENGGYPHPDHIQTHNISVLAYHLAADADYMPELGEPWAISKLYYHLAFSAQQAKRIHHVLTSQGLDSPYADMMEFFDTQVPRPMTTRVNVAEYLELRDAALKAHATQVDPDGFFFAVPLDVRRQVWPTDDYQLRFSRVGVTIPEDDLFEGIRP